MAKYRIMNYGATRRFPYKGQYYEISRNSSIETEDKQFAKEFNEFQFVDAVVIDQPAVKAKKPSKRKKKVATKIDKKTKQSRN